MKWNLHFVYACIVPDWMWQPPQHQISLWRIPILVLSSVFLLIFSSMFAHSIRFWYFMQKKQFKFHVSQCVLLSIVFAQSLIIEWEISTSEIRLLGSLWFGLFWLFSRDVALCMCASLSVQWRLVHDITCTPVNIINKKPTTRFLEREKFPFPASSSLPLMPLCFVIFSHCRKSANARSFV